MFAKMLQRRWYPSLLCLLLLPLLVLSSDSVATNKYYNICSEHSHCGNQKVTFPFRLSQSQEYCGYPGYELNCSGEEHVLTILLGAEEYYVKSINYDEGVFIVIAPEFLENPCPQSFANISFISTSFNYALNDLNLTVYLDCNFPKPPPDLKAIACSNNSFGSMNSYYKVNYGPSPFFENLPGGCSLAAAIPVLGPSEPGNADWFQLALKEGFGLTWNYRAEWCQGCMNSGGICGYNKTQPEEQVCFCPNTTGNATCNATNKRNKGLIIGLSVAGGLSVALICSFCLLFYTMEKRKRRSGSSFFGRIVSFQPSSKSESEFGCSLHAPIFKYEELYEATNGFDDSKELGDGGFGTVYKGKLRDGRVVAVKRLYENNCRRVEQFLNEVNILSLLRHQNLVSLYGCTSRHSRELLLVYEFVSNGTVSDHLHGSLASESPLPWQVRMSIAIETADALNYLHSVEPQIIHRDIKTNNILLDNNFHVKVGDFGLSRLFPLDATHVSTAPQGTPGYVDPEYHMCYQLTDKSDVYSFGVVLMELISSKPAVDITRQRNEINLSHMAINKIQRQELHEFVDLNLGYLSDRIVNGMINQVAELAFQCLQSDREMRPSIKDVLKTLREVESSVQKKEGFEKVNDALKEEAQSLKRSPQDSPNSVAVGWVSVRTTPNNSD